MPKQKFCTLVFNDLHCICELTESDTYKCIPEYCEGNSTDMTFATKENNIKKYKVNFFDNLVDAVKNHNNFYYIQRAKAEDAFLTQFEEF
jgi:hypothetical protein